jgi:hypothetical protein
MRPRVGINDVAPMDDGRGIRGRVALDDVEPNGRAVAFWCRGNAHQRVFDAALRLDSSKQAERAGALRPNSFVICVSYGQTGRP